MGLEKRRCRARLGLSPSNGAKKMEEWRQPTLYLLPAEGTMEIPV
jgi:hypothetical protein